MEKKFFQRASLRLLTLPVYFGVFLVRLLRYEPVLSDFEKCTAFIRSVDKECELISDSLLRSLFAAEDHRNSLHFGVDPIAIVRALIIRVLKRKKQGASTIEQQFVRTVTARYERTPRRKVREQVLATMLAQEFSKKDIAVSYLACAFYGSGLIGFDGIKKIRGDEEGGVDEVIVAYLRYPKPSLPSVRHFSKHRERVDHIRKILSGEVRLMWGDCV
ncbi:transglycosylase domain-containing protein [Pseudomonas resinovorans]|uniref:Transglycosylase domain-containing protein n=1 Tax=Metapseudomonas resinovorans TaxID=53412 RepID=A0ABT4YAS0_METRE|nr:biosynthetic peptidoglycan transglycosylase [Pseudomonas resinovorans]MDA8485967.1 transglycosylase domain-containing protein [Pseudomonas resinovorans]